MCSMNDSFNATSSERKPVICKLGGDEDSAEDTGPEDEAKLFKPITAIRATSNMQRSNTYDKLTTSSLITNRGVNLPIQIIPHVPSLGRVSTYGSGLNQPGSSSAGVTGQDSLSSESPTKEPLVNSPWLENRDSMQIICVPGSPTSGGTSPGIDGPLKHSPYCSRRRNFRYGAGRKIRRRAVFKNGDCNILQSRLSRRRLRFLQDIFTTLVDTQWRWTLLAFALSFIGSWLGFALLWWLIAFTHGDLEEEHLPQNQEANNWQPCMTQIYSFTSCFLFSIETQHTIGYGSRSTTEECPEAVFVMCLQSIAGVMIQAFMVGIVFAKMTRPKHRTQTLLFSRNAVICQRDGQLCFMFRVGDMRKSHIIGANVRAQLIRSKSTKEGEVLSQYQTELTLNADGCNSDLFFIWPMTIVHVIDESSPLYNLSAADLLQERFEIVVILEGTIESTGQTTQARSSYITPEILWGHRFEPMVHYNKDRQGYEVDYSNFNSTIQVDTPLCSARELHEFYRVQDDIRQIDPNDSVSLQRTPIVRR